MIVVIFLGIIQGLSEFLPISSSAHLLFFPWLLHLADPGIGFDAAIHLGTGLALVIYFWRDIWRLIARRDKLLLYIVIASIPGAIFGFLGQDWIDKHLHQASSAVAIVAVSMIIFSLLLYWIDHTARLKRDLKELTLRDSILIGFGQAIALIPGVSRSGATISTGLLLGFTREEAARFSFLLAIPITLGAGAYSALKLVTHHTTSQISPLEVVVGIVVSAVVGWLVIRWLLLYLANHNLTIFIAYRIILALSILAIWFMRR